MRSNFSNASQRRAHQEAFARREQLIDLHEQEILLTQGNAGLHKLRRDLLIKAENRVWFQKKIWDMGLKQVVNMLMIGYASIKLGPLVPSLITAIGSTPILLAASVSSTTLGLGYAAFKSLDRETKISVRKAIGPYLRSLTDFTSPVVEPSAYALKFMGQHLWLLVTDMTGALAHATLNPYSYIKNITQPVIKQIETLSDKIYACTGLKRSKGNNDQQTQDKKRSNAIYANMEFSSQEIDIIHSSEETEIQSKQVLIKKIEDMRESLGIKEQSGTWAMTLAPVIAGGSYAVVYGTFVMGKVGHIAVGELPLDQQYLHGAVSGSMVAVQAFFLPFAAESRKIIENSPELIWQDVAFQNALKTVMEQYEAEGHFKLPKILDFAPITNWINHHVDSAMDITSPVTVGANTERRAVQAALDFSFPVDPINSGGEFIYKKVKKVSMRDAQRIKAIWNSVYKDKAWTDWMNGSDLEVGGHKADSLVRPEPMTP